MSIFGFGSSKSKSSTVGTATKDEVTNQNTQQSGDQKTSGTQTTQGASTGQTTSQQTQGTSTKQTTDTKQQSSLFSNDVLSGLESVVQNLFGAPAGASDAVAGATKKLDTFDPNAYVASSVDSARSTINSGLDASIGTLQDKIGGTGATNSMAALLQNRLTSDAASSLEGVRADATKTAEGIQTANQSEIVGANQTQSNVLANLLAALKGGSATTTGTEAATGKSDSTAAASGTTAEQTQQTQQTMQDVISQLQELLSGTTNTLATENSTTKGKTSGFGISL